jgi:hypothetical protein
MSRLNVQGWLALILTGTLAVGLASSGVMIGVAIAKGSFRVDNARVSGNSTIFDGASVQTEESSSRINLHNGTRMALGPDSRAKVMAARLLLEKGLGELQASSEYRIEARTLRIAPADPNAIARVLIEGDHKIRVEAVNGPVKVFNHAGHLVANVNAGLALSFEPQAAQEDSFQVEGCLLKKQDKFILVDQVSNQVVELRGSDVSQHVCNRVKVAGTAIRNATPIAGASQVIQVDTITQTAAAGCLAAAGQVEADPCQAQAPSSPVASAEGKSHAGIYVGVAVAAAGGIGAAVALSKKGGSK